MPVRFRVCAAPAGASSERVVDVADDAREIRLGRRADLELPLPFKTLSSIHARVGRDRDGFWIEDAGSTNGTRVGGTRLAPGERRPLIPGAELRLAEVRLVFEGATAPAQDREPTEGTATIARRLVADLFDASSVVTVTAGAPPQRLVLAEEGRLYVVGRADTCALSFDVEHVSREHAAFLRTPAGVILRDLGSKNGVLVNATRVTSDHVLSDADQIQIGPVTLTLEDPVSRYIRELEEEPVVEADPVAELPAPRSPSTARASTFSRFTTTVAIGVLAAIAILALSRLWS
jgi:pSer/pThr/pTyr-binding forkhead associated (FHA) protein